MKKLMLMIIVLGASFSFVGCDVADMNEIKPTFSIDDEQSVDGEDAEDDEEL